MTESAQIVALLGPLDYMFGETLQVAFAVAVALGALLALVGRLNHWSVERTARNWLFVTSLVVVVLFTQHSPYEGEGRVLDLTPFGDLEAARISVHRRDLVLANIALFMPFGAAMAWRGTRMMKTVLLGVVLSLLVETLQYFGGQGRIAQLEDLIYNTFGTAAGWVLVAACLMLTRGSITPRGDAPRSPRSRTPQLRS